MQGNSGIASSMEKYGIGAYSMKGVALVRGEGEFVFDADGNRYIDCISGHGSTNLGHAHPAVVQAVRGQAGKLIGCPKTFYNDAALSVRDELHLIAPKELWGMFFCNSGTEAVEAALKLARACTKKKDFVACIGSFHGRRMGSLSLTWSKKYREAFEPLLGGVRHVRFGDAGAIESAIGEQTAAVILEPIQGEVGVKIPPEGYLRQVREICDEKGVLLILDEVQTGFARTGLNFECEREGVVPDAMCLAKSMAAGLPIGAIIAREGLKFGPKQHGSTFGDNPLVCAAAAAAMRAIREERLAQRSALEGGLFLSRLAKMKGNGTVNDVRGRGMMIALEVAKPPDQCVKAALSRGLLVFPGGESAIRAYPPLIASRASLDRAASILEEVLS